MQRKDRAAVAGIDDREVLSGREFLELCRFAEQSGGWIPAVDVVGVAGYRIAHVVRKQRRKTEDGRPKTEKQMELMI